MGHHDKRKSLAYCAATTVVLSLLGCRPHNPASQALEDIPGSYSDTAFLGQAYDTTKKKLYNVSCVQGTEIMGVGNSSSELTISSDMDYQSLVRNLDGNLNASVSFPAVSAGASAKLALDAQYDDRSETHNIIWIGVNRKKVFKPNSLSLTPQGQKYVDGYAAILQDKCGDEYVKEIQYGASLFATLKVEYLNSSDKFEVGGAINVSAKEILKVDANAQFVHAKIAKRTKVTVLAKQFGGNPAGLLTVIPKGIVTCSFDNMQPCVDAFNNIVDYAVNHLSVELTGIKSGISVQNALGQTIDSLPAQPVTTTSTTNLPGGSYTSTTGSSSGSDSTSTSITLSTGADGTSPAGGPALRLADNSDTTAWNILKYSTVRYDESGFEQLRPTSGWSTVDAVTKKRRGELQDRYVVESDISNRASFLINSASGYMPATQLSAIKDIKQKADGNINILVDAQIECLNVPKTCSDRAASTLADLAPYDKSVLDIEIDQKRTIGIFNYYNIVGGYNLGQKYDDTKVGGNLPVVSKLRFATTAAATTAAAAGANASNTDAHLTGIMVFYKNGQTATHGNMNMGQTQEIDLSSDGVVQFKIYFTSSTVKATPGVTGLSILTKAGSTVTVGTTSSSFGTFKVNDKESFVGFIGSSGAEVDSLGVITRSL